MPILWAAMRLLVLRKDKIIIGRGLTRWKPNQTGWFFQRQIVFYHSNPPCFSLSIQETKYGFQRRKYCQISNLDTTDVDETFGRATLARLVGGPCSG